MLQGRSRMVFGGPGLSKMVKRAEKGGQGFTGVVKGSQRLSCVVKGG